MRSRKAKQNVTSMAGQKMQARVWKEIIEVLKGKEPEVSKIAKL
jgi:23S rRNA maturation mini-RNase III